MSLLKQTDEPLFPDTLWNQPVSKRAAKRLLIIGGHKNQFSLTQDTYQAALDAGIGDAQVLLPVDIRKLVGQLPNCHFLPATPSGSIAREALPEIIAMAKESDGIVLPGELSTNAETVALLEQLLRELDLPVLVGDEVLRSLLASYDVLLQPHIALVSFPASLSELASKLKIPVYVKKPDLMKEVRLLENLKEHTGQPLVIYDNERAVVNANSQTSVTDIKSIDQGKIYGNLAVWWLQQPDEFKALTTGAWQLKQ